jgi:hypothetical protein
MFYGEWNHLVYRILARYHGKVELYVLLMKEHDC